MHWFLCSKFGVKETPQSYLPYSKLRYGTFFLCLAFKLFKTFNRTLLSFLGSILIRVLDLCGSQNRQDFYGSSPEHPRTLVQSCQSTRFYATHSLIDLQTYHYRDILLIFILLFVPILLLV
jgi:hypothetical protein